MSFRNLVEDQCGAANSLVQLSNHFVQDRALKDQGILHPFQHENFTNQNEQVRYDSVSFIVYFALLRCSSQKITNVLERRCYNEIFLSIRRLSLWKVRNRFVWIRYCQK